MGRFDIRVRNGRVNINPHLYDYYASIKPDFMGDYSRIFVEGDKLYKFYRYDWDQNRRDRESITYLSRLQSEIKYTMMPLGCVYKEGRFVGTALQYFAGHDALTMHEDDKIEDKITYLKKLKGIIEELNDHYIYFTGLQNDNILVSNDGDIQIIGFDGAYTPIELPDEYDYRALKKVLRAYRQIILKHLCGDYIPAPGCYHYPGRFCGYDFVNYISENLAETLNGDDISYDALFELIDRSYSYIKKYK